MPSRRVFERAPNSTAAAQVPRCSLSSMAFLLAELVSYTTARCASHEELVARLLNAGFEVGRRAAELVNYRCARARARDVRLVQLALHKTMRQVASNFRVCGAAARQRAGQLLARVHGRACGGAALRCASKCTLLASALQQLGEDATVQQVAAQRLPLPMSCCSCTGQSETCLCRKEKAAARTRAVTMLEVVKQVRLLPPAPLPLVARRHGYTAQHIGSCSACRCQGRSCMLRTTHDAGAQTSYKDFTTPYETAQATAIGLSKPAERARPALYESLREFAQVSNLLWPYLFSKAPASVERDDTVCQHSFCLQPVLMCAACGILQCRS